MGHVMVEQDTHATVTLIGDVDLGALVPLGHQHLLP